jgi:adenylate cyclase
VNAGHDAPYVRATDGRVMRLAPAEGPPLCVIDDFEYQPDAYHMSVGQWLFTETDGVTEATNQRGEFFGTQRPEALLAKLDQPSAPAAIVSAMIGCVHEFAEGAEPADDITVMALRWNGGSSLPSAPASER